MSSCCMEGKHTPSRFGTRRSNALKSMNLTRAANATPVVLATKVKANFPYILMAGNCRQNGFELRFARAAIGHPPWMQAHAPAHMTTCILVQARFLVRQHTHGKSAGTKGVHFPCRFSSIRREVQVAVHVEERH